MTGGPPVRGTKLTAWEIPPLWEKLENKTLTLPEGSTVPKDQAKMMQATLQVLESIAKDIRGGLLETVGIESSFSIDGKRCSMTLDLPEETETEQIALAIDAENIEAWLDDAQKVHIAVNPWYSTKDVDQTVLSTIKVIHVILGVHASDNVKSLSLKEKLMSSVMEIFEAQKKTN